MNRSSPAERRFLLSTLSGALLILSLVLLGCDRVKSPGSSRETSARSARRQSSHTPRLAIIIDDIGADPSATDAIFALHYPLTLSILPNHPQSTEIADQAHRRGYQVILHLPMESQTNEAPESRELRPGMTTREVSQLLDEMVHTVPYAVGVNNHQGSRATADPQLMSELMPLLRSRNLFFIDSRTTAATVAYDTAERDGVPSGFRNVPFLDDVQQETAIRHQLDIAVRGAKEKGEAIVIGHPHPETLKVLREMLPQAKSQGVELVHVSALIH